MHEQNKTTFTQTVRGKDRETLYDSHVVDTERAATGSRSNGNTQRKILGDSRRDKAASLNARPEAERQERQTEINLAVLPFVRLSELPYLPQVAGIYFLADAQGGIAYIGQSGNIFQRWRGYRGYGHHIAEELPILDVTKAREYSLHWLEVQDEDERLNLERSLIQHYRPKLNRSHNPDTWLCNQPKPQVAKPDMKKMLTTPEVAERLGISTSRVRQLILEGRLPSQQFGRDHLIKESDLALIANRKTGRPKKDSDNTKS